MRSRKQLENRLILHLSRYSSFKNRFALPFELTQDGIARELGILRNHVPGLVKSLEDRGLVYEKKARVVGAKNRRKTYFLTEKGIEMAKKLSEMEAARKATKRNVPRVKSFFGRKEELEDLKKWWKSSKKIAIITGMKGIGKTTLVAEFIKDVGDVLWYSIQPGTDPESIIKELRVFDPWSLLDITDVLKMKESGTDTLSRALSHRTVILDNLEEASEELMEFIVFMMRAVRRSQEGKMVLISSYMPENIGTKSISVIKVGPLDRESFLQLGKSKNFRGDLEKLYESSGGNPSVFLLRELEEDGAFLNMYSISEMKIMEIASLYDEPVDFSAFLLEKDTGYESFLSLLKKGAIESYEGGRYALSSVLKDIIRKNMDEERKKEIWREMGEHLSERGDIHWRIQASVYLIKAGEYQRGRDLIVEVAKGAITGGYDHELRAAIEMLPEKWRDADIAYIQGNLHEVSFQWKEAMRYYAKAEELFRKTKNMKKMADSIRKQGTVLRIMDRFDEAMDRYSLALRISKSRELRVKVYDNMGTLELLRGNLEKGKKYIERALEYARKIGDEELIGLEYNSLGNAYLSLGKWKDAEERYLDAIKCLESAGNRRMLAIALNNLAISYYKQLKLRKASTYWKRSAEISKDLRDISFIYSEVNRAEVSLKTGEIDEADRSAREVLDILSNIEGYSRVKGAVLSILGRVEELRGNLRRSMRYHREALSEREKSGNKKGIISSKMAIAEIFMVKGDFKSAEKSLKEIMELTEEWGLHEEGVEARIMLSHLLFIMANPKKAEEILIELMENKPGVKELEGRIFLELGRVTNYMNRKLALKYLEKAERLLKPVFIYRNVAKIMRGRLMVSDGKDGERIEEEGMAALISAGISEELIEFMSALSPRI